MSPGVGTTQLGRITLKTIAGHRLHGKIRDVERLTKGSPEIQFCLFGFVFL